MVFSSITFLYFFLPLTAVAYYLCKNLVWRNTVLLIASVLFYSWGEPKLVFLMLLAAFVAYVGGLGIDAYEKKGRKKAKKLVFIITTLLLVCNLLWFKYFNFFVSNVELILGRKFSVPTIMLPIGISFYTFQILSYVIDLYWGNVGVQKNYFYLTLYLCFFPQLIAGPIVRYQTVEEEIRHRKESISEFSRGLRRFIVGLAKKIIIANNVARVAELVYGGDASIFGTSMYWLAAVSYALQIYFDFSGYSDMAIGLGRMFGFHFLENFRYPYVSLSITEFWRRWHISLSTWFRDYIYIPLGGNRCGKWRHIFNIAVVWAVTGFWHGAQWNFILWGVYYGALLLIEKFILSKVLDKTPKIIRWFYTMVLVLIGWVMFNLTDFSAMTVAFIQMFKYVPTNYIGVVSADSNILYYMLYIPLGLICMLPFAEAAKGFTACDTMAKTVTCNICAIALFALCIIYIFSSTYNPFIYFRF